MAIHLSPLHKRMLKLFETPTQTEVTISKKDYRTLIFVILCGSIIAPFLLLQGLNETTATNTALLLNAECLFTVLIAFFFLRERGKAKDYIGIFFLFIGVVILTTNADFGNLTVANQFYGNILIVGACLFWGIDNNLSKFLSKKRDIILVTGLKCFIGGFVLLVLSQILGIELIIPAVAFPYILTVGTFSIAFSVMLFLFSLREIGSMQTGVIFAMSSVFGALFSLAILGESLSFIQLFAGFVMIFGVYVLYRR